MKKENAPEKVRLRSKSLKITAGTDFTRTVLNAAVYLTVECNDIASGEGQPVIQALRAALMPAYDLIAEKVGGYVNVKMQAADLTDLSADLLPTLGVWSFQFKHRLPTGKIQPYKIKVAAQDGLNTYLRISQKVGYEEASKIVASI